jgi:hypothetical protein
MVAFGVIFLSMVSIRAILGDSISQGIGGSLVATGMAGLVLFLYVRSSDTLRERLEVFTHAGMTSIFPHRSVRIRGEYDRRFRDAKKIDLAGYGLSSFREDYRDMFVEWSERIDVRILLPDPDFPTEASRLADQRDKEEGRTIGDTHRDILAFEETINQMTDLDRSRFQVRRFRAIPAINFLRIDDEIFWGPYLIGEQSRNTPTMLVTKGGFLFDVLTSHFERLWNGGFSNPTIQNNG